MPRQAADTKERVLRVAHDLFYRQGIRATGVDHVAQQAGVAPTQLYRLFGSKDGLVEAYVELVDRLGREWFEIAVQSAAGSPRAQILAVFDGLGEQIRPPDFRGCACLMTLAEYPDPGSAAHRRAVEAKQWIRDQFRHLCRALADAGAAADPLALADDLALVFEGTLASAQELGPGGPAARARALAERILDDAARAGRPAHLVPRASRQRRPPLAPPGQTARRPI